MPSPLRLLVLVPTGLAGLAFAGCAIGDDGPPATQTRDVAGFTRIDNRASVDVRVLVGAPRRVRVHAGEKVIDDVRAEVHDGTLRLSFDHHGLGSGEVRVDVSVPTLEAIEASGSGDIEAHGIDGDVFELRSDGSADIALQGTANRLTVDLDGSGDADLADLTARQADVLVGGSGDADLRADDGLDVTIDGSGDVRYHGHPALTQRVDGSGELSHVE
jgi:Putative auto-transporter adhesin, head GIN domain